MPITLKFEDGSKMGAQFKERVKEYSEDVIKATQATAKETARDIEARGRADIAAGGNFSSPRWQEGWRAKVSYKSRYDLSIRVTHAVKYWKVFEFGAKILGKPLLWIPLSFATGVKGVRARDYASKLFRVDRKNGKAPLLLDYFTKKPKYFGKESVTIPRKWHLRDIVNNAVKRMPQTYKRFLRNARRR